MATNSPDEAKVPSIQEIIAATERLLRTALQEGRPRGTAWEATQLYRAAEGSHFKTEATLAACLSEWQVFVRQLDAAAERGEFLSLDEITVLLIHRTYKRARRKQYRDEQMADQLRHANGRGADGEFFGFDPAAPEDRSATLKYLLDEIALVLEGYCVRDRLIFELRYFDEFTPKQIVEKVRLACPGEPISPATVSRVLSRFEDELRPRLLSN